MRVLRIAIIALVVSCAASLSPGFAQEGGTRPTLAVLDLQSSTVAREQVRLITDLLTSYIVETGAFRVIERTERDKLLTEIERSVEDTADARSQLKIGKLLSAEQLVIGSLGKVGSRYVVTVKLAVVETGETRASASQTCGTLDEVVEACPGLVEKLTGASFDRPAGGRSTAQPRTTTTVRIGIIAPLSGSMAGYGTSARDGTLLCLEQLNAGGGLPELSGATVSWLVEDDGGSAVQGIEAFNRLVAQGVSVVIGAVTSQVSLAIAPLAQRNGIPMISPSSTNARLTEAGEFVFRACFLDYDQGVAAARFAFRDLKVKTAAILANPEDAYTTAPSDAFRDEFIRLGGKIVGRVEYVSASEDLRDQLAKIKAAKPATLFIPAYSNAVGAIMRQVRAAGIKATAIGTDGWDDPYTLKQTADLLEGSFFVTHFSAVATSTKARAFVLDFQGRYAEVPDSIAELGYEAAMVVVDALRRARSADPRTIRDALERTDLVVPTGRIRFDQERNPLKGAVILEVKGGTARYRTVIGAE
jgi:branched-chain amino acid transport system substrate-binding protein